jgi:DNA-binding PadR family transcriptional regulator
MARENKSRYAILGLLSLEPMSGYDIRKKIASSIGHFWSEGYGQIYPILKQLVAEGLATCTPQVQTGRPDRLVYALTPAGEAQLRAWLHQPVEPAVERNELLLKLFFGRQLSPADSLQHIHDFRARQEGLHAEFLALEKHVREQFAQHPDAPFWRLVIGYGVRHSEAMIGWCDEVAAALARLTTDRVDLEQEHGEDQHTDHKAEQESARGRDNDRQQARHGDG